MRVLCLGVVAFWGLEIFRFGVFGPRVSPLRPSLTWVPPSPNRFRAVQLKPRLKSDSWVPEMCSTEIRPGPCPPRPSGAGNVSTRNRPLDPAVRKPSSQDQTWGHRRGGSLRRRRRAGRGGQGVGKVTDNPSSFGSPARRSGITAGRVMRVGTFLTTASGAGEAKTRHWRRAGPLRKAGAECRAVTTGAAGLEIVDQSEERPRPPKARSQAGEARPGHSPQTPTN